MEPEPPTTEMDAFGAEASEELDIDAERIAGALHAHANGGAEEDNAVQEKEDQEEEEEEDQQEEEEEEEEDASLVV